MTRRHRFFRAIVRRRALVLALAGVALAASAVGAARVRVDYGVEQLLPSHGAERRLYDEYKALFPREDLRFSLFWEDRRPPGRALLADMERAVRAFRDAGLEDVQWPGQVPIVVGASAPGSAPARPLAAVARDPAGPDDARLRSALAALRDDPRYRGLLWNPEQSVWALHGFLPPEANTDAGRREVERALTVALDSLEPDDANLVLTGVPVLRSRIPLLLQADQRLFLGAGAVLFFGLLLLFLRRPALVLTCLGSTLPAYLCTLGLMGALDRPVSILTSFLPIVVLVVGVSDAIHLVVGWRARRAAGGSPEDAVVEAFAELSPACFYTSLTTAIGFAALAATGIGLVAEFGLLTALAIGVTFAFAMTVLPAVLSWLPARVSDVGRAPAASAGERVLELARMHAARPLSPAPALFGAAALVALAAAGGLRVDTYLVDDLKDHSEIMRELRWVEDRGFGLFQANVLIRDADGGLDSPEWRRWLAGLRDFGSEEPLVLGVAVEEAEGLGGEAAQVVFAVRDAGSAATLPFLERLEHKLAAEPPPAGRARATGLMQLFHAYTARVLTSFGPSLALGFLTILGILIFMFRSVRLGLVALIPNVFPLAIVAGAMGAVGIALKPSTVLVFSLAFAIAVDDTIHLLGAFRRSVARGLGSPEAIAAAVAEAGPGILASTVVVSAGFALLMLSSFEILFLVGLLTLTSSLAALLADLFLFPALLHFAGRSLESRASGTRAATVVRAGGAAVVEHPCCASPPFAGGEP
ncbi:MAG TPA: MMPL family transporter [Longimicrobiales bacterium]|nr:MMPL family transporter [Longimicrobiales bacterium]